MVDLCFSQQCKVISGTSSEFDLHFSHDLTPENACDKIIKAGITNVVAASTFCDTVHSRYPNLKVGLTNILGCIPWKMENETRSGVRSPEKVEAVACRPRLLEIIKITKPRAIICLGKKAVQYLPKKKDGLPDSVQFVDEVVHPSYLLRIEREDPIRYAECRNRTILTFNRAKLRLWGLEE
jgi:hypothetical protein